MKKVILILSVALFALSASAQELNVATFNVRVGRSRKAGATERRGDYKKYNGWDDRKGYLCDMINFEAFDIFGVQEARYPQIEDMVERLPDYSYIGQGREDGVQKGEHCAIFYRKKQFKLLDEGHFWLSETPDVPSKGWGAKYYRICTWGLFQDKATKEKFYFINTHVNWGEASAKSAHLITKFIKENCTKCENIIVTADFNATQDSELYKIFLDNGFEDTYTISKYRFAPTGTGQGFRPHYYTERRIDHIFVSKGITSSRYGVLTYHYYRNMDSESRKMETSAPDEIKGENRDIKCISDHYAVQSFVTLKKSDKK